MEKKGFVTLVLCLGIWVWAQDAPTEKEIFLKLGAADRLAETKQYEKALAGYLDCLETCHKYSSKMIGPVAVNLSFLADSYPQGRERIKAYLQKSMDSMLKGELNPIQMRSVEVLADAYKLENMLVDSFSKIMVVQRDKEHKLAWGEICFNALYKAKQFAALSEHFDMFEAGKSRLFRVKTNLKTADEKDKGMIRLGLGRLKEKLIQYRSVYEKLGKISAADKMNGLIDELGKLI